MILTRSVHEIPGISSSHTFVCFVCVVFRKIGPHYAKLCNVPCVSFGIMYSYLV